jgi:hypothetical protein
MCLLSPVAVPFAAVCPAPNTVVPVAPTLSPGVIVATDHLKWARAIARGVRRSFNFGIRSQEEQDLQATAYLAVVELARRFDWSKLPPGGDASAAFRGWATIEVRSRCRREARRLRNGGAYHTRRERPGQVLLMQSLQNQPALVDPRSVLEEEECADGMWEGTFCEEPL